MGRLGYDLASLGGGGNSLVPTSTYGLNFIHCMVASRLGGSGGNNYKCHPSRSLFSSLLITSPVSRAVRSVRLLPVSARPI